jgi:8-oxo-dGTP diphosphatase
MSEIPAFAHFGLTVDFVVLTIENSTLKTLLVRRTSEPFPSTWALPGALVQQGETLEGALLRSFGTSTNDDRLHLEQLYTHTSPERDPRGNIVSISYLLATASPLNDLKLSPEFGTATLFATEPLLEHNDPPLAFDHQAIVKTGVERTRAKLEYTTLATNFLQSPFTIEELRSTYEVIWGFPLNPLRFRKRVMSIEGFIVPHTTAPGRPNRFVQGPAGLLHPALLRESPQLDPDDSLRRRS